MSLIDEWRLYTNNPALKVANFYRPSEFRDRVNRFIVFERQTISPTPSIIFTVTNGFNLYISSLFISALNTSTADGQFRIRDNTTTKIPFLIPSRVTGSSPSAFSINTPALPEPILFSNNINLIEITGSIEVSGFLIGYEEPI